jgi:iron complex outermembrane receptor protein
MDADVVFRTTVVQAAPPAVPLNVIGGYTGSKRVDSEDLLAYELGYRAQPMERLSLDLTAFFNVYDKLRTAQTPAGSLDTSVAPAALSTLAIMDGRMDGKSFGAEAAGNWGVTDRWRLRGAYSFLHLNLDPKQSSNMRTAESPEGKSPLHQFHLRSFFDLTENLELDTMLYIVSNLANQNTHSYTRLDLRVGWRPTPDLELSLALQNLLEHRHKEFGDGDDGILAFEVPRSIYGRVTWRY